MAISDNDYRITEITFSTHVTSLELDYMHEGDEGASDISTRKTTLVGNVLFEYRGLTNEVETGSVIVDLADICEVEIDPKTGEATSITTHEFDLDADSVVNAAKEKAVSKIESMIRLNLENTTIKQFLNKANNLEGIPNERYIPAGGYEGLSDIV